MSTTLSPAALPVLDCIDANFEKSIERLSAFLKIPSISTDTAFNEQTREAAVWICKELSDMGFDASVRDTTGHPMVVAHHPGPKNPPADGKVPHLLYYGHYDVQPPDPLDLWESEPFEPVVIESKHGKKIVARGAVDDKGQLMLFVEAFRAWLEVHGDLPVRVTVMLEGEEESGSPSLDPFLEANKEELTADACIVSDTGMWDIGTPAVTYMLRGLVYSEITLHGPDKDLHSGMYGGAVVNPINELTKVLAQLVDENGVIQIPGMYDDVLELSEEQRAEWDGLGFDEAGFLACAGLKNSTGEKGRSTLERTWSRPTCDINGIWGGYIGEGAKTVIAAHAKAKVSFRLVANQDPRKIYEGLRTFLEARTPPECRWEIHDHGQSGAIRVGTESPFLVAARAALSEVYQKDAVLIGCGGSIPVVGSIQDILGFDSLLVGFGLDDDQVHSPNEKFELRCYQMGIKSHANMMAHFASMNAGS